MIRDRMPDPYWVDEESTNRTTRTCERRSALPITRRADGSTPMMTERLRPS